ncbi:hypothetical protein D3C72_1639900 [compost metagenome]
MREVSFAFFISVLPVLKNHVLDTTDSFFFRDARISNTVQMLLKKSLFVFFSQITVVRDTLVVIVRYQVENVFFQVCTCARDRVNFTLADHFSQRKT